MYIVFMRIIQLITLSTTSVIVASSIASANPDDFAFFSNLQGNPEDPGGLTFDGNFDITGVGFTGVVTTDSTSGGFQTVVGQPTNSADYSPGYDSNVNCLSVTHPYETAGDFTTIELTFDEPLSGMTLYASESVSPGANPVSRSYQVNGSGGGFIAAGDNVIANNAVSSLTIQWQTLANGNGAQIVDIWLGVPEPSSAILIGLAASALGLRRRRGC